MIRRPVEERFWEKVQKAGPNECWLWTATTSSRGYGNLGSGRGNEMVSAHRVSWGLHNGPIPDGMFVCHKCDNPPCVNPAHLFLGAHTDNVLDRDSKGRQARGVGHGNSKLSEGDVRNIRLTYAGGGVTQKALGKYFGVSKSTISFIICRDHWRHVT